MIPARVRRGLLVGAVCGAALLLLPLRGSAEEPPRTTRTGEHFRVVLHWDGAPQAQETLRTVEALWRHAADLYGLGRGKLAKPLEVHLYRDTAAYERAMDEVADGRFKPNLACALWDSHTAHVAVQPPVSNEVLRGEGLPYLTKNLLLHEAAHLVRFHAMPNYRSHPQWLADGAAQWLKFEALRSHDLIRSLAEDPMSARGIERARTKGRLSLQDWRFDRIRDEDFYVQYAARRLWFTYLMTAHGKETRRLIQRMKGLGGGGDFLARVWTEIGEAYSSRTLAGIDQTYAAYLETLQPAWSERFRSLETAGPHWTQIAFPDTNAVAWRTAPVDVPRYTVQARLRLLRNYGKQANILLDRRDGGFVSIAFTAGYGINVFAYDAKTRRWEGRAKQAVAGLALEKDHDVRIVVAGTHLQVVIGDETVADVAFPERKGGLRGPWGLGAQAGSAVRWSNVAVR